MKDINKLLNEYAKKQVDEIKKDLISAGRETVNEIYREAVDMYDSFITQYYRYKTKSYIRHGETAPGTGQGMNLFRANCIKKNTSGKNCYLDINISSDDMESKNYVYDDKEFVLDNVLEGFRGVPGHWIRTWEGTYTGKWIQYTGTLSKAFDILINYAAEECFLQKWRRKGW